MLNTDVSQKHNTEHKKRHKRIHSVWFQSIKKIENWFMVKVQHNGYLSMGHSLIGGQFSHHGDVLIPSVGTGYLCMLFENS